MVQGEHTVVCICIPRSLSLVCISFSFSKYQRIITQRWEKNPARSTSRQATPGREGQGSHICNFVNSVFLPSRNDSPRYSHLDDKVSSSSQCHCRACGIGSPSLSCCIFLGLQWHWSASAGQSQPEAIDNGHCQMETIPQHLNKEETKGENRYLKLHFYNWRWAIFLLVVGLGSAVFHTDIMKCPLQMPAGLPLIFFQLGYSDALTSLWYNYVLIFSWANVFIIPQLDLISTCQSLIGWGLINLPWILQLKLTRKNIWQSINSSHKIMYFSKL